MAGVESSSPQRVRTSSWGRRRRRPQPPNRLPPRRGCETCLPPLRTSFGLRRRSDRARQYEIIEKRAIRAASCGPRPGVPVQYSTIHFLDDAAPQRRHREARAVRDNANCQRADGVIAQDRTARGHLREKSLGHLCELKSPRRGAGLSPRVKRRRAKPAVAQPVESIGTRSCRPRGAGDALPSSKRDSFLCSFGAATL